MQWEADLWICLGQMPYPLSQALIVKLMRAKNQRIRPECNPRSKGLRSFDQMERLKHRAVSTPHTIPLFIRACIDF